MTSDATHDDRPAEERFAVRAVLLTRGGEILLMKLANPDLGGEYWVTPGGGREPSEDARVALAREIEEETGFACDAIGPEIWRRTAVFPWFGRKVTQHERYFLVPVERFEPIIAQPTREEEVVFRGFRWWTIAEIGASDERIFPLRLAELLQTLYRAGPPSAPIDVGT